MEKIALEKFHCTLTKHRDTLLDWISTDSPHKEIHLRGAPSKNVYEVISELKKTLNLIDDGKFGLCEECEDEVEQERLELDYTTCVCLDHYSKDQIHAIENDLQLAAKVQRQLLPCGVPSLPGIQIAVHAQPARIVGSDYHDFFAYKNSANQGLVLADVMGKGLPASLLMSNLQASLRILGPEHKNLHSLATRLNQLFRYNLTLIRFISMFLAKIDSESGVLFYCNAGHNPPFYWEAASSSIKRLKPTGPALGLTHAPQYTSKTIQLGSGDVLLFYTDGLIEVRNSQKEEFGEHQLATYLKSHIHQSAENILHGLRKFVENYATRFEDDVTLMVM